MNKLDSGDMYAIIANYPKQFADGFRSAEIIQLSSDIDRVLIIATGTNAIMAKLIVDIFESEIKIPFVVHSGDELPEGLDSKTLVIVVDLTGKAPNVLSALQKIHETNCQIVVITTGKEVEIFVRERGLNLILLSSGMANIPERMLSGYILSVLIQILINAKIIGINARKEILQSIETINQLYLVQQARRIADSIKGYLLLVYAKPNYAAVIEMAKIKFNLNCKLPCFVSTLPEVMQSEVMGFNVIKNLRTTALIFDDTVDNEVSDPEIQKLTDFLDKLNIKCLTIPMPGGNKLERILGSILLTDWISYWLALSMNVDPLPTPLLDDFMLK
jgi:hypothetical protein